MRIQTIEITNYKAFLGTHKIEVGGKNVFIYGENGSGKSSLYYALKDFFQASMEDVDLAQLENVFVPAGKEGKAAVKVTFKPNHHGQSKKKPYLFNAATNDARDTDNTSIRDGNRLKSFLTYKHLLAKGVLKHFKYSLTGGKELGKLWDGVDEAIARSTGKEYRINKKKTDVNAAIKAFNEAFGELFKPESPENSDNCRGKEPAPHCEGIGWRCDLGVNLRQTHDKACDRPSRQPHRPSADQVGSTTFRNWLYEHRRSD